MNAVLNPKAVQFQGRTLLLVRVEDCRGFSHLTVATSEDGKEHWEINPFPSLAAEEQFAEEQWGLENPRIVWLEKEKCYAITYVAFGKGGPLVSLALTEDFKAFVKYSPLLPPEDKDAALFPCRFKADGRKRYALVHRPIIRGEAHTWISFSPDLRHWEDHQVLIPVRPGWWGQHRVGLGIPPVATPRG